VKAARSLKAIAIVLALLVVAMTVLRLWVRQPMAQSTEPVTVITTPFQIPFNRRDQFTLTLGPDRRWVNRAETLLFGRRRNFDVFADVFQLPVTSLTNVELAQPVFTDTNGLRVWFASGVHLKNLSAKMEKITGAEVLSRPRLSVAEGRAGSLFIGHSVQLKSGMEQIGFGMQSVITARPELTELLTGISHCEVAQAQGEPTIKTNIDLVARLNVPKGSGVLIIKTPGATATNGYGIVISPLQ
jgi:hypothetical protein